MRTFLPGLVLMMACGFPLAAQETEIQCVDGSRIRGSLIGIGSDRVEFGADFLAAPVPLRLDQILDLTLPVHTSEAKGDHVATVTLSNGDMIRGELTGVNETEIRLKTWYAGEMTFRRVMVDTLEIEDRPEILYAGPNGLDGWTQDPEEAWVFEGGALRSKTAGGITRTVKLPSKTRFAFDLAWRSTPKFRFLFFADGVDEDRPSNCYELICQGRYVQQDPDDGRRPHRKGLDRQQSGNVQPGRQLFLQRPGFLTAARFPHRGDDLGRHASRQC